ncbi:MAG: hypothetical protein HAW64_04680 [Alphaproteobacteria bacterium]|nr:hypothetical protein [Alphaproteobacteria bacterium]
MLPDKDYDKEADFDSHAFDSELADLEAELPLLLAMRAFGEQAINAQWFENLGRPLDEETTQIGTHYLETLGFSDSTIAPLADWQEALDAASTGDINSPAWEAEEQARAALVVACCAYASEEGIGVVLTYLAAQLDEVLRAAATGALYDAGYDEEDISPDVVIGAAQQVVYQAALVYGLHIIHTNKEDKDDDFDRDTYSLSHPLYLKYQLFARGHWAVALIGRSFHIF